MILLTLISLSITIWMAVLTLYLVLLLQETQLQIVVRCKSYWLFRG